jgi:hypothetical protein
MGVSPSAPGSVPIAEIQSAARRQARRISAGLAAALGTAVALLLIVALVALDYRFGQEAHRLVKILVGVALGGLVLIIPRFGLFLLPVATPFLSWMPRIPVPGVNVLNVVVFTVFGTWALGRVFARQPIVRRTRLGAILALIVGVAGLSVVRGAAFPTGYGYDGLDAAWGLVRCAMTFVMYFLACWMVRGDRDRSRLTWAIVVGLIAEAVVTLVLGRNGSGARAVGSFGQPNELGAFLAMFTVVAVALLPAARRWLARVVLGAAVIVGGVALVTTVSRGAVLAFVVALVFVAMRTSRVMILLLLAALVTAPLWAPDDLKQRVLGTQVESESSDEVGLEGSAQLRVDTWRAILKVVTEHPLDGVGFCGLATVLPETGEALGVEVKDSAHNTYLRFLGEMGIFGLLLFVALLWRCWILARDGMRLARDRGERQLALGLGAATLALAISCAFGDRFFSILISGNFWLLCAVVDDMVTERRAVRA